MTDEIDFGADAGAATGAPLEELRKIAVLFKDKTKSVEDAEAALKIAKAELNRYACDALPAAFAIARLKDFTLEDGAKISLSEVMEASLPSMSKIADEKDADKRDELIARRNAGLAWLKGNGGATIIKNILEIEIPKEKSNSVAQIAALCDELGLHYEQGESVHTSTLKSFLKEKLKQATAKVPLDVFAIFQGKKAKLKAPKPEKSTEPLI